MFGRRRRARRRRSSFAGSPGGVRWLQPVKRRERRRLPIVPILLLVLVAAAAAGAGWVVLARQAAGNRQKDAAARFASAWTKRDYPAMWRLLTPERRKEWPLAQFADSYRVAAVQATVTGVKASPAGPAVKGRYPYRAVV